MTGTMIRPDDTACFELLKDGRIRSARQIAKALGWPEKKNMNSYLWGFRDRLIQEQNRFVLKCRKQNNGNGARAGKIWWIQERKIK